MEKKILILLAIVGMPLLLNAQINDTSQESWNALEKTRELIVSVQPNPASNFLMIETSSDEKTVVQIIDVLGNTIWNATIYESEKIDITEFRNGVYFVNVSANGTQVIRKILVKH